MSRRRRLSLPVATVAVAFLMVGALLVGTRVLGAAGGGRHEGRSTIGMPAIVALDEHGDQVPFDGSGRPTVATSRPPLTVAQPAPPQPTTPPPPSRAPTVAPRSAAVATANGGPESQVVALVNAERANAGCTELTVDGRLTAAARGHSSDMAARDYFSHDTPEGTSVGARVTNAGYQWSMVGENIAWGQQDAQAVMKDWMNSSGHRANILNCKYRNIGVGLAYSSGRRPYWTQDFGTAR